MKPWAKLQLPKKNSSFYWWVSFESQKTLYDHLLTLGKIIYEKVLVLYVLNGNGPRYLTFVTSFNMTQNRPSINILHSLLENYERMLGTSDKTDHDSIFKLILVVMVISKAIILTYGFIDLCSLINSTYLSLLLEIFIKSLKIRLRVLMWIWVLRILLLEISRISRKIN